MIPKSGYRFLEKTCSNKEIERDGDSTRSHRVLRIDQISRRRSELVIDRCRMPSLGALRPERLAQERRERARPIVAEDPRITPRDGHDAPRRRRQENLVGIA